jgi:hypothetical protein
MYNMKERTNNACAWIFVEPKFKTLGIYHRRPQPPRWRSQPPPWWPPGTISKGLVVAGAGADAKPLGTTSTLRR